MKTFIIHIIEKFRASAWTIPAFYTLCGILLSQLGLWLDHSSGDGFRRWTSYLGEASPEGARVLLSTIASSMLVIAGMSFSGIVVALSLASQQFGPRLLRNFIRDTVSQSVLGILIGTFVFCLLVMRGVKSGESDVFVPNVSIIVAVALSLAALAYFIKFIHHIVNRIQAERVVADAFGLIENALANVFSESNGENGNQEQAQPEKPDGGWPVAAGRTGYVQAVNIEQLVEIASDRDMVLTAECRAGDFVTTRQPVLRVVRGPRQDEAGDGLVTGLKKAFFIDYVRTPEQDQEYGMRQLVEIALRALSPGINDPFTAMSCVNYLGAGLQLAFRSPVPPSVHRDRDGQARLFSWESTHKNLVETAVNQIRQAAIDRCDVSCRLLEMLAATADHAANMEQLEALSLQARLIHQDSVPRMTNEHDSESIDSRYSKFNQAYESAASRFFSPRHRMNARESPVSGNT